MTLPLADLTSALTPHVGWIVFALVVGIGLLGIGLSDLLRFHYRRVNAIAGVCFAESIRRRVLWITPVAIVGVFVVAQLQKPFDEQDAIRQITKFCLFATGLVVVISTVILACTSLPREIENRVIFTVVTKPTSRLEIVVGKIVGFAAVSAAILAIMGLFTWGYLHLKANVMERDIAERLRNNSVETTARPSLEHYAEFGLLNAKSLLLPTNMQMFSRLPQPSSPRRYFSSNNTVLVPFVLPDNFAVTDASSKAPGMIIRLHVGYDAATAPTPAPTPAGAHPDTLTLHGPSPLVASSQPTSANAGPKGPPQLSVQLYDPTQSSIAVSNINDGKPIILSSPEGSDVNVTVPANGAASLSDKDKYPFFYVGIGGGTAHVQFWVEHEPATLIVPLSNGQLGTVQPTDPAHPGAFGEPVFNGRQGLYGQMQLAGSAAAADETPVCLYSFRNADVRANDTRQTPLELRLGIERNDEDNNSDSVTRVQMRVHNLQSDAWSLPVLLTPENNRTAYAAFDSDTMAGGNFDVELRCLTPDNWIGLTGASLQVVRAESSFGFNLFKSLAIIWLLTVLVVSIAIFCSTFLSWPIAVVLTLVILLGRWGVEQVADSATAGLGRQFVQDFGVRDPAQAQALSTTVEQLNKLLGVVAAVLPDIDRFSATDDIQQGVSVPASELLSAAGVCLGFGLPLTVLAYIFLKNKEVAP